MTQRPLDLRQALLRVITLALGLAITLLFCLSNLPAKTPAPPPANPFSALLLSQAVGLPLLFLPTVPWLLAGGRNRLRNVFAWRTPDALPFDLRAFIGHAVCLIAGAWALVAVAADDATQSAVSLVGALTPFQTLALLPFVCGLGPLAEELLYRGALFDALGHRAAPWATAVLFALAHGPNAFFFPLFFVGLWLGFLTQRQGTLLPAIALHAVFNLPTLLLA